MHYILVLNFPAGYPMAEYHRLLSIRLLMALARIQMAPKDFFFPKNPVSIKQTLYFKTPEIVKSFFVH